MNAEQTNQLKALLARAFERKAEILRRREEAVQDSLRKMAESRNVVYCYNREPTPPKEGLDSDLVKVVRPPQTTQKLVKKVSEKPSRKMAPCKKAPHKPNPLKVVAEDISSDSEKRIPLLNLQTKDPTFSSRVVKLVRERFDNDAPTVYRAAGVSRQVYSKIISNADYPVSRHTAIQLAFGLKLPLKEAGSLLHAAGFHFSPCRDEDIIFTTCLEAGIYDLTEVNQVLQEYNIPPLSLQH